MSYVPVGWTSAIDLTAKNLNQMETQYAAGKVDIDLHGHPTIHYTKAESDAKFFPIASGLDADKIDGNHLSDLVSALVPLGAIWLYKGIDTDFTNGYLNAAPSWHQCDGSTINGIICGPDMRGYFPKCPSASNGTGAGGATTQTLTGTVTFADHTLSVAEMAYHQHKWTDRYYGTSGWLGYFTNNTVMLSTTNNVSGLYTAYNHDAETEAHNHSTGSLSLNAINLTPLWRANWFICKIA